MIAVRAVILSVLRVCVLVLPAVRELVSLSSEEEEVEPNQETGPSSLTTARRRRLGPKTTAKMREIFEGYRYR